MAKPRLNAGIPAPLPCSQLLLPTAFFLCSGSFVSPYGINILLVYDDQATYYLFYYTKNYDYYKKCARHYCKSLGMNVFLAGMCTLLREDGTNTELGMRRILSLGFSSGFYQPALDKSVYLYKSRCSHL